MAGRYFKSNYKGFRNSIVTGNQFVLDDSANAFLAGVRKSVKPRMVTLPKGAGHLERGRRTLRRSQKGLGGHPLFVTLDFFLGISESPC